ncbi:MAG: hypothetical protein WC314_22895 [Vulcanimicrobiota bacterium]
MASQSGKLESELSLLSRSLLGEELTPVRDLQELERVVTASGNPATITLRWWGDEEHRQALVIHEVQGSELLLFDPTRELVSHLKAEGREIKETSSEGMFLVSRDIVEGWFVERDALGLLPSPLRESES